VKRELASKPFPSSLLCISLVEMYVLYLKALFLLTEGLFNEKHAVK